MFVGDSRTHLLSFGSIFLNQIFFQNEMQVENIMSFRIYGTAVTTHEANNLETL